MTDGELILRDQPPEPGESEQWPLWASIHELVELARQRQLTAKESVCLSAMLDAASSDADTRHKGRTHLLQMAEQNAQHALAERRIDLSPGAREMMLIQRAGQALVLLPRNGREDGFGPIDIESSHEDEKCS